MKKIKITKARMKYITALDWVFFFVCMTFSLWAGWQVAVAFIAYELMRAFEGVREKYETAELLAEQESRIIKAVASAMDTEGANRG